MRTFIRKCGGFDYEVFIEEWNAEKDEFDTVCHARLLKAGDVMLITMIKTKKEYRNKGYGKALVLAVLDKFKTVHPAGIVEEAKGFWSKLNLTEAIGVEY